MAAPIYAVVGGVIEDRQLLHPQISSRPKTWMLQNHQGHYRYVFGTTLIAEASKPGTTCAPLQNLDIPRPGLAAGAYRSHGA